MFTRRKQPLHPLPFPLVSLSGLWCTSLPRPFLPQAVSGQPLFLHELAGAISVICLFWGAAYGFKSCVSTCSRLCRVCSVDCHVGSMCMSGSYAEDNKLEFKKKKKKKRPLHPVRSRKISLTSPLPLLRSKESESQFLKQHTLPSPKLMPPSLYVKPSSVTKQPTQKQMTTSMWSQKGLIPSSKQWQSMMHQSPFPSPTRSTIALHTSLTFPPSLTTLHHISLKK